MDEEERAGEDGASQASGSEERPPCQCGAAAPDDQKKAYADLNDRYLRLAADFENFRKRTARDREQSIALANERFAADVLEIVDNLERAQKADDAHLREGLGQIQQLRIDPAASRDRAHRITQEKVQPGRT